MAQNLAPPRSLKELKAEISYLKDLAQTALAIEYPRGATVYFTHGSRHLRGVVLAVATFDLRVKVAGDTGKEYWIDEARITQVAR